MARLGVLFITALNHSYLIAISTSISTIFCRFSKMLTIPYCNNTNQALIIIGATRQVT